MHLKTHAYVLGSITYTSIVPDPQMHMKEAKKLLRIDSCYFSMISDKSVMRQEQPLVSNPGSLSWGKGEPTWYTLSARAPKSQKSWEFGFFRKYHIYYSVY